MNVTPRSSPRRPRHRLWPLLFLPLVGVLCGLSTGRRSAENLGLGGQAMFHVFVHTTTGLVAGSVLMTLIALGFLGARIGVRQFTIRSVLIAVAGFAVMLGLVRACLVP